MLGLVTGRKLVHRSSVSLPETELNRRDWSLAPKALLSRFCSLRRVRPGQNVSPGILCGRSFILDWSVECHLRTSLLQWCGTQARGPEVGLALTVGGHLLQVF